MYGGTSQVKSMNSSDKPPSKASWSEKLAWGAGIALLLSYGGTRMWLDGSSERAVASFRQISQQRHVDAPVDTPEDAPVDVQVVTWRRAPSVMRSSDRAEHSGLQVSAPDTTQWSAARKEVFEQRLTSEQQIPLAILRIDELALEVPVYGSTDEWNLNRGAGWIEGTSRIGQSGNVGVAAHRDGYFRALKDVELGQKLMLETMSGTVGYRISSVQVVAPDAIEVLAPTEQDSITLVTCYPFYYVGPAPQRLIVTAQRIESSPPIVAAAAMEKAGS